jgi:hypothetical protein
MKLSWCALLVTLSSVASTAALADSNTPADSNSLPAHATICVGSMVHKPYLLGYLLTQINNAKNKDAQVLLAANVEFQARLFTDEVTSFCAVVTKAQCGPRSSPKDCAAAIDSCTSYKNDAVLAGQQFFKNLNREVVKDAHAYSESSSLVGLQPFQQVNRYFVYKDLTNDATNGIACTKTDKAPPTPTAQKDSSPLANFRVRGKSDDLYIDRSLPLFKATTPAALNWNGTDKDNYNIKANAALGYTFDVGNDGQLIPYVSANQSLGDTAKKPRTIDPNNNVAVGFLATRFAGNLFDKNIQDVFTAKPEYLFNTADRSEITRLRLIYAPWTDFPNVPINANTFQMLPFLPGPVWASLLFDLRNDAGTYTKRADTAAIAATDKTFDRAGTRVGLSFTTDPNFPSLTLTVIENYLYGFAGFYRNVNSFQTILTYNLESNNYFGISASYQNGRDEDTGVASHTYTIGLTVRY